MSDGIESVVGKRGSVHVPNCKSFLVTEAENKHVRHVPSLVAVACFLLGRVKDLSAPPHTLIPQGSGPQRFGSLDIPVNYVSQSSSLPTRSLRESIHWDVWHGWSRKRQPVFVYLCFNYTQASSDKFLHHMQMVTCMCYSKLHEVD